VRLQIAKENEEQKRLLDERSRNLQSQMALVGQQQLIHDRMVDDVAKAHSARDQSQVELNAANHKLGAAVATVATLTDKLEKMKDYDGRREIFLWLSSVHALRLFV